LAVGGKSDKKQVVAAAIQRQVFFVQIDATFLHGFELSLLHDKGQERDALPGVLSAVQINLEVVDLASMTASAATRPAGNAF
jgi:hypothetical protein